MRTGIWCGLALWGLIVYLVPDMALREMFMWLGAAFLMLLCIVALVGIILIIEDIGQ